MKRFMPLSAIHSRHGVFLDQIAFRTPSPENIVRSYLVSAFFLLAWFSAVSPRVGYCQQISLSPSASTNQQSARQASLPHLYWHLLQWQNHLDKSATEREKAGRDGTWLRNYLQKQLGFSDSEFAPVRKSAQHLETTIAGLHMQAKSLVRADLALYASGKLQPNDTPPNLAKVKQLEQQREAAIAAEIATLNAALGSKNALRLQAYVQGNFSSHVTVVFGPHLSRHQNSYGPSRQALGLEPQK